MKLNFFQNALDRFTILRKKKSFRYGAPFLIYHLFIEDALDEGFIGSSMGIVSRMLLSELKSLFLFVGSFGVEKFASLRYEFRRNELLKPEFLTSLGIEKKKVDLDEEFEKYKKVDLNAWENIRGPRPWEEPQEQIPAV